MFKNFNYDYDSENDSLFLYDPTSKSKSSIELDDLIIDFNSKKEISGIEILNASSFFKSLDIEMLEASTDLLKTIRGCKIDIITKSNFLVIKFMLLFEEDKKLAATAMIPTISEPSPALAVV
ncbi:DUF2283 domain-containing protein [Candidatus Woesearchaeota archaeon]|nr:DUF2283 domain-containing protein [Candidatus Woesearchaeota archaeon]